MPIYIQRYFKEQAFNDQAHQCQSAGSSGQSFTTHSNKAVFMIFACNCRVPAGVSLKEAQTMIPAAFKLLINLDHLSFAVFKLVLHQTNQPTPQKIQHTK